MTHTNAQVAAAFVRQEPAQSKSMHSVGNVLYSYDTPIARHDGATVLITTQDFKSSAWKKDGSGPKTSTTTSRHKSELMQALHVAGYSGGAPWKDVDPPVTAPFGITGGQATDLYTRAVVWEFSQSAYDDRATSREWYEQRNHTTVTRKERDVYAEARQRIREKGICPDCAGIGNDHSIYCPRSVTRSHATS